ncbi:hypothetical protein [Novosphingobium naphthalenivorans]|uniref:hypothetical protein n=1 Tax=Novosphingobium naphthalenivorans TaxID=273168 RepID=UPI000829AC1D|nr:hypothetical protein [Novosphingobium naphthalenivorans]
MKDLVRNLHIERQDASGRPETITLEEWTGAVELMEGVRMAKGDAAVTNPLTEQVVTLPNRGGDAEIFREDCHKWLRALFWTPDGMVRFAEPGMAEDPIIPVASKLANTLRAHVCDEDGKPYRKAGSQSL